MGQRDGSSRGSLRRRVRELERDNADLTKRLAESTRELVRCGWWQETGHKPPGRLQAAWAALWTRLVRATH